MFGKKKARELQEIQEARTLREKRIDFDIAEAVKIKDPVEKILELEEIRKEINNETWKENSIIFKKANKSFSRAAGTSLIAAVGGGAAATVATLATGGIGILVALPILLGGTIAGAKHAESVEKKLKAEVADHLKKTETQRNRVTELIRVETSSHVQEISDSPLKEKVLAVRDVAAQFADAAAKRIAAEEKLEQEITPVRNEAQAPAEVKKPAAPRRKKQNPDYKNLKGL